MKPVALRQQRHRSASPSCGGGSPASVLGVAVDGSRGEVWRAVALQAHLMGGMGRGPPRGGSDRRGVSVGSGGPRAEPRLAAANSGGRGPAAPDALDLADLDYEEKLRRHQASLTLAQRMGLVAEPSKPLTTAQWEAIRKASDTRDDSSVPCSICLDDFRERSQVILSCSHVFHHECLRSFEQFSGARRCPLCRCPSYDATVHFGGFKVWRNKSASRIQRAWRGHRERMLVFQRLTQPDVRAENPALHRRYCGRALKAVGGKLERACEEREDALDRFLEELDGSVARCSAQLREGLLGFEQLHGSNLGLALVIEVPLVISATSSTAEPSPSTSSKTCTASAGTDAETWAKARRDALGRADEIDCPICFQPCQLRGSGGARVELLSCSHVFHRCCVDSFESFHVFEKHLCPVCRQNYDRRPWQQPLLPAGGGSSSTNAGSLSSTDGLRLPRAPGPVRRNGAASAGYLGAASRSRPPPAPSIGHGAAPNWRVLRSG